MDAMTATLVGLSLDVVGAAKLVDGLFWGPTACFEADYACGHIEFEKRILENRKKLLDGLPTPPSSNDEDRRMREDELPELEKRVKDAEGRLAWLESHESRAQLWDTLGILLRIVGFVIQGYCVYLSGEQTAASDAAPRRR